MMLQACADFVLLVLVGVSLLAFLLLIYFTR